jgi:hypothetical protein
VSIFDLIFLLAMLSAVVVLIVLIAMVIQGRFRTARRVLSIYAICAVLYLGVGLAVSYTRPRHIMSVGEPWCFDDWCLAVDHVNRTPEGTDVNYQIALRIFSRAGRVSQRANGAWIYLIDDENRRYAPDPQSTDVPLDVLLQPEQSVVTSRTFHVPANARQLGLITGHGGPYCGPMSLLVIGDSECLFGKPPMIRIQ